MFFSAPKDAVIKRIYLTHQRGLSPLAPTIIQGLEEVMAAFPEKKHYDRHFPIINIGNWKEEDGHLSPSGELLPYKSIDWYIERAKQRAVADGRWQRDRQISVDQLCVDLANDPYTRSLPQYSILLTSYDLYGTMPDGTLLNFCNGITIPGKFSIVSTARFLNDRRQLDLLRFQTVVMHEFGHLIGMTPTGRRHAHEELGTHCSNHDIMEQDMSGTGRIMLHNRMQRAAQGLPLICSDCISASTKFLDREIYVALHPRRAPQRP